jgi:periplasmic protein TonB
MTRVASVRLACLNNNDRINPRNQILPVYPPEAVASGVQDVVIVEFTVGADGRVEETRIIRSVPPLDEATIAAVERWEFAPTRDLGFPVRDCQTVAVQFFLL